MIKRSVVLALTVSTLAHGQDARDDAIFGSGSATPTVTQAPESTPTSLVDNMQIGGRLELRSATAHSEHQKGPESSHSLVKRADVYFDTRPNKDLRTLLRLRFSETQPVNAAVTSAATQVAIDEFWFKWDLADSVFFTLGKQHVKWGSGRIWNPTDFTAVSVRDPMALFDLRLGQELLKIHIPIEKQGFNYYAVFQFDSMKRADDLGAALRSEFAFGGIGELALSFQTKRLDPIRFGADVSSGLGPIDVYVESAVRKGDRSTYYEGDIDLATLTFPTAVNRKDKVIAQTVAGVQYSYKYNDEDNFTVGAEVFDNGLGYTDRELELLALVMSNAQPLYAGRQYAGLYLMLPTPGSWNETSFYLNAIHNLSDETTVARLTGSWQVYKEATFQAFVSECFGDYGELCFRVPQDYKNLATSPILTTEQKAMVNALPTNRTRTTLGLAMIMKF